MVHVSVLPFNVAVAVAVKPVVLAGAIVIEYSPVPLVANPMASLSVL